MTYVDEPLALTGTEFRQIRDLLYEVSRISLNESKRELVQTRLGKRIRILGLSRFRDYLSYVQNDATGQEMAQMVDLLSTNLTFFLREPDHFAGLKTFIKDLAASGQTRFRGWSAGCSSGEEAYSMAMVASEALRDVLGFDALILATDVSSRMIDAAKAAVYPSDRLRAVPDSMRLKYFTVERHDGVLRYHVKPEVAAMVRFVRHNLNGPWPMKGLFDVIFCRNVMIYFDNPTQNSLVERFIGALRTGGLLVLGHSEGLMGTRRDDLKYISPGVYQKTHAQERC